MKVKIFAKCGGYFSKSSKISSHLEQEINAWLESNPKIKIIDIKQSSCGGSLEPEKHIISIWHETKI
jgi:hypothetical protein